MHIISRKALRLFWEQHPESQTALERWFKVVRRTDFKSFSELRATFPSADKVDDWIVFNIGGNKYRLIASVHFNRGKLYMSQPCAGTHAPPHNELRSWRGRNSQEARAHAHRVRSRRVEAMTVSTTELQRQWSNIGPLLTIRNEREYDRAIKRLNDLLDHIGTNERHPLYELLDTLGTLLQAYEERHHPLPDSSGAEVLRFFMEEHALTQSELPEVGSQGVVSEILSGKRDLNVRQIRALAERFHVSAAVFI